jgi:hypothetical protein
MGLLWPVILEAKLVPRIERRIERGEETMSASGACSPRRRKMFLIAIVCVAVAITMAIPVVRYFQTEAHVRFIGPEQYARLHEGMTPADVDKAVGLPPGDYYSTFMMPPFGENLRLRQYSGLEWRACMAAVQAHDWEQRDWWGPTYRLQVVFDEKRRLIAWYLWERDPPRTHRGALRYFVGW